MVNRNKRFYGDDDDDARDDNDGAHPTPVPPKRINDVGGIAQRKQFIWHWIILTSLNKISQYAQAAPHLPGV